MALSRDKRNRFLVTGFQRNPWPVTVRTDLPVVLEQLPEVVRGLVSRESVCLDFFEQGIERIVRFEPHGSRVVVSCVSRRANWQPDPSSIVLSRRGAVAMLLAFAASFARAALKACPDAVKHPWFATWRGRLESPALAREKGSDPGAARKGSKDLDPDVRQDKPGRGKRS